MKWITSLFVLAAVALMPHNAPAGDLPEPGAQLPAFSFPAPENAQDREYLGLEQQDTFQLAQTQAPYVLIEIIGVYCAQCRAQLPGFNKLFKRLQRSDLSDKVKMLAIGAGATLPEVTYLRKKDYQFPVLRDETYEYHKMIGEPLTPFTMLATREGEVLYTHLGVIRDIDGLLGDIQRLTQ